MILAVVTRLICWMFSCGECCVVLLSGMSEPTLNTPGVTGDLTSDPQRLHVSVGTGSSHTDQSEQTRTRTMCFEEIHRKTREKPCGDNSWTHKITIWIMSEFTGALINKISSSQLLIP